MQGAASRVDHGAQSEPVLDQVAEECPLLVVGQLVRFDDQKAAGHNGTLSTGDNTRAKGARADPRARQNAGGEPGGRPPEMAAMAGPMPLHRGRHRR